MFSKSAMPVTPAPSYALPVPKAYTILPGTNSTKELLTLFFKVLLTVTFLLALIQPASAKLDSNFGTNRVFKVAGSTNGFKVILSTTAGIIGYTPPVASLPYNRAIFPKAHKLQEMAHLTVILI